MHVVNNRGYQSVLSSIHVNSVPVLCGDVDLTQCTFAISSNMTMTHNCSYEVSHQNSCSKTLNVSFSKNLVEGDPFNKGYRHSIILKRLSYSLRNTELYITRSLV
jgi:hypothetical protein